MSIINNFNTRPAVEEDIKTILYFINELAIYEKLENQMHATEEGLTKTIFKEKYAEVVIADVDGKPVGFALFFHNYSTWEAKPGLYLEDLYVTPEMRGFGYGKKLLQHLAKIAVERDCARFEWSCLDWNEPSIKFYKSLGAVPMDDWTGYRLTGEALINMTQ